MCDFIYIHEVIIHTTSFEEYRVVMRMAMTVVKEVHDVERKKKTDCK